VLQETATDLALPFDAEPATAGEGGESGGPDAGRKV
jgi:hypothetical protein